MRVLVQFPDQLAMVKVTCEDTSYGSLLTAVSNHKYAQDRGVKTLWYHHVMSDGSKLPVEVDEETLAELSPSRDVVHVVLEGGGDGEIPKAERSGEKFLDCNSSSSEEDNDTSNNNNNYVDRINGNGKGRSTSKAQMANGIGNGVGSHRPHMGVKGQLTGTPSSTSTPGTKVPPLELSSVQRLVPNGYDHRALPSAPVNDIAATKQFLQQSQGRMEAIKIPRLLRSLGCQYQLEDVWSVLRVKMSKDGFVPHAVVCELIAELEGNCPSERESPHLSCTPRTSFTPRDVLPLGASAVSPLPAGKSITEILMQSAPAQDQKSSATFRTVEDWTQQHQPTHHRQPSQQHSSHKDPYQGPGTAVYARALSMLKCVGSKHSFDPVHLPQLLAALQLPSDQASIHRTLTHLRITKGRMLGRRDLAHILAKLLQTPPERALPAAVSRLEAVLNGSEAHPSTASPLLFPSAPYDPLPQRRKSSDRPTNSACGITESSQTSQLSLTTSAATTKALPLCCSHCDTELTLANRLVCGSCRMASYCGQPCIAADWPHHQPICDTISQHGGKKLPVLVASGGIPFHVHAVQLEPDKTQYLLIVSQRVPIIRKVFVIFVSVSGQCEYSHPPPAPAAGEAEVHQLISDIFAGVFEEAVRRGIWTLSACCLGTLRAYRCRASNFEQLITDYKLYYTVFLSEACRTKVCDRPLRYSLIVPPLLTLCEAFESRAMQQQDTHSAFVLLLSEAKDYYLVLLSFLQDTTFVPSQLAESAAVDRREVMRKVAVVYQHLAATDKEGKAMSYLTRSEVVLLRLTEEVPSAASYNLLALLYDCLPHDATFRQKAALARQQASKVISGESEPEVEKTE